MNNLVRRAGIIRKMRAFFDERGFVEVTTPVRIPAPAPEPHIDCPIAPIVHASTSSLQPSTWYLRASPEIEMKKLLAAGMDRIYQIGPCFREGELGSRHNPEFTMIEWYRRNANYNDIATDMKELLLHCQPQPSSTATSSSPLTFTALTVREAYQRFAGWDPWESWNQDRFDFDMAEKIEPNLPEGPVFLTDYPPQAASLAKLREDAACRPRLQVAERWELYWQGIELANCFTELCDSDEQRRRFRAAKEERKVLGESDYPIDEDFLNLLPLIGSASGVALGVDRLVMLLCGEKDIHAVM